MSPDEDSTFPISIAASAAHLNGDTPETNRHWHPFCMTSAGVERIKTVNSPAEEGMPLNTTVARP